MPHMKLSHATWILFTGAVWFAIGSLLLSKGLGFIILAFHFPDTASSLMASLNAVAGPGYQAALFIIFLGLLIGFFKGKFVLAKTVERVVSHIRSFPSPVALKNAYTPRYFILIALMMCLGMAFKWLPLKLDIKGFIDVAIGSALINGAVLYFRHVLALKKEI